MNILRTRRVAATALLAAGGLFLVASPAQATCMMDDKGQQICGINQSGPTSGPGSYTGNNGVNNSSPGALGPDGQPMTWGTPPPVGPGAAPYTAPNADTAAGSANNFVPPAPVTAPQANQNDAAAKSPYEYAPPASANNSGAPAGAAAAPVATPADPAMVADAEASAAASAAQAAASAAVTPAVTATMTERAARPTKAATASVPPAASVATERAAATEAFNPAPLIAGIGAVLAAAGLVWFIPGARTAVTSVFTRVGRH
ncbi:MAG TPA: hypothetical protein VF867_00050 [Arthrobacter sp.]